MVFYYSFYSSSELQPHPQPLQAFDEHCFAEGHPIHLAPLLFAFIIYAVADAIITTTIIPIIISVILSLLF